jgi:hypothetical protein
VSEVERAPPSLVELVRVIKTGACIEASFNTGKGEAGMDEYQVHTWEGRYHRMLLSLISEWFLIGETHRGQQLTPALTSATSALYGLSLLLGVFYSPSLDYIGYFCTTPRIGALRHGYVSGLRMNRHTTT